MVFKGLRKDDVDTVSLFLTSLKQKVIIIPKLS